MRRFAFSYMPRRAVSSSPWLGAKKSFMLADIGEGIAEVEVLKWFVATGDAVEEFQDVCEVQSDKATVTITSPYEGVVEKLHYAEGDIAKTHTALMDIEGDFAEEEGQAEPQAEAASSAEPSQSRQEEREEVEASASRVLATPTVRRLAREHNVDLARVPATGRGGRVLKEDMMAFLDGSVAPLARGSGSSAPAGSASASAAAAAPPARTRVQAEDRREPIRGIKRAMVASMTATTAVPWFGYSDEIDASALVRMRQDLKEEAAALGFKLSYMPFIIKATSVALSGFPILNSSVNPECTEILYRAAHNIGIAMDTPQGLLVPAVRDVRNLSIMEIASELNRLQQLGSAGKLGAEDLADVTFSISNIGNIGGTYLSPVPPPPTVAIGALGKIRRVPRFVGDSMEVREAHIFEASWRADHRIVDGADVARFSEEWRKIMEKPSILLLH